MKKAICIALVVAIVIMIFCGPLAPKANAIAVTATIVAAVIAVMAISGITIAASGVTAEQLKSLLGDKLGQWANSLGKPLDHLINSAGIGITMDGLMVVTRETANGIKNFIAWLQNDMGISAGGQSVTINYPSAVVLTDQYQIVCNFKYNGMPSTYEIKQDNYNNFLCYCVMATDAEIGLQFGPLCISKYQLQVSCRRDLGPNDHYEGPWNLVRYDGTFYVYYYDVAMLPGNYVSDIQAGTLVYDSIRSAIAAVSAQIAADEINNHITFIPSAAIDTAPITQGSDVKISTGALPGTSIVDLADDLIDKVIVSDQVITGNVEAINEPATIVGNIAVPGLTQVFPFCLPFDVYNFLSALAADPEAPHFEWRFYVPGICDETLEIDLSVFNTVAQILRTMELLAFIVGLAFVTRSRFIRS